MWKRCVLVPNPQTPKNFKGSEQKTGGRKGGYKTRVAAVCLWASWLLPPLIRSCLALGQGGTHNHFPQTQPSS